MNQPKSAREIAWALSGVGDLADRVEALSQVVLGLMVEVEALRDALARTKAGGTALPVHGGNDIPCTARELVEGKAAYPAAYVDTAFVPHNAAGPSGGIDKLVARFYPADSREPRETIMLRRLGYTHAEIARFLEAARAAENYT
ncbi:MAG: hypothetical protein JNK93_13800 [Planctomycetia bacterium]|nr:hypothetical protein [Planctomycetia bacterium]